MMNLVVKISGSTHESFEITQTHYRTGFCTASFFYKKHACTFVPTFPCMIFFIKYNTTQQMKDNGTYKNLHKGLVQTEYFIELKHI
jgi:hypothetical protein